MPKKGKKGSRSAAPPSDIGAAEPNVIDPFVDDNGFDLADELLAALDERDAQSAASTSAAQPISSAGNKPTPSESSSKTESTHTGLRGAGERLINGLRHHGHDHSDAADQDPAQLTGTSPSQRRNSIRKLFGGSDKSAEASPLDTAPMKKVSRQQQRKDRKAAEAAEMRRQAEEEVRLGGDKPDEAEMERKGISSMCAALGVSMHEINPDGHCLYAAVADQLNLRRKVDTPTDYKAARRATAQEMRTHPDEYKPFISDSDEHMAGIVNKEAGTLNSEQAQERHFLDYCSAVENTGVWGGQPEILALSRAFHTQINVVQSGVPVLKVGEGEYDGEPLFISYHRKMYGLGEHYNSLRPASAA
ncbi:Ovarian tumor, otubain [Kalmanozyma brasiliensis GHG001]|nr:Ovarian tumor, otubain [Kalmanozyma brasiliensis GHG001]EST09095.2 Ovarian tumor, otubain [Kalmanozyma brasiliensis GHG001]